VLFAIGAGPAAGQLPGPPETGAPPGDEALLLRHFERIGGGAALLAAGDVEIAGRLDTVEGPQQWRLLVRRQPFTVREERRRIGDSRPHVHLTDLSTHWRLHEVSPDEPGVAAVHGHFLDLRDALPLVLRAFTWKLLLGPIAITSRDDGVLPPFPLPDAPFFHDDMGTDRAALTVPLYGPLGLTPNAWFDVEDACFHGWQLGPLMRGLQRLRVGRWTRFGELLLPARLLDFDEFGLVSAVHVESVATGLRHDDALFAGRPQPATRWPVDLPLELNPSEIPRSGHAIVEGVRLNGQVAVRGLADTGATWTVVLSDLAGRLRLPYLAPSLTRTLANEQRATRHWLDELSLGTARFHQVLPIASSFPAYGNLAGASQPALILGQDILRGMSPVHDFADGRFRLRGPHPQPLRESAPGAGSPASGVAVADLLQGAGESEGLYFVELSIGGVPLTALLDTGFSGVLRLSAAGLRAAGLPVGRAVWRERGGQPYEISGAGGPVQHDLLVRLDAFVLPARDARTGEALAVVHERPWVLVAGVDDPAAEMSLAPVVLGLGAFTPFAQVGLDEERERLEMVPGSALRREVDALGAARLIVPAPGEYVGLFLERRSTGELPRVVQVGPGSLAERAGLRAGDVLERVDGEDAATLSVGDLWSHLWFERGPTVHLSVSRGGRAAHVVVLP